MDKVKGWYMNEVAGFSILNPRGCFKITGDPEKLKKLYDFLKKHHPELLEEEKDG